jgi:hypothetical protein
LLAHRSNSVETWCEPTFAIVAAAARRPIAENSHESQGIGPTSAGPAGATALASIAASMDDLSVEALYNGISAPAAPAAPDPRETLAAACRALDHAQAGGQAAAISQALAGMAAAYRGLDALSTAEAYLEMALRWAGAAQLADQSIELLCELCDTGVLLALQQDALAPGSGAAARERVRDHAFAAGAMAHRAADGSWEVKVLLRVSGVLNRLGDHDEAALLQSRALRLQAGCAGADAAQLPSLGRLADT